MSKLPIWTGNPNPGIYAHVSWAAERIMQEGLCLGGSRDREGAVTCPLEGNAIAVSLHPRAWAKIARIGTDAPVVVLKYDRPALDVYKWLRKRHLQGVKEVTSWGVRNGWIQKAVDVLEWSVTGDASGEPVEGYVRYREEDWQKPHEENVIKVEYVPGWRFEIKAFRHIQRHGYESSESCMTAEILNLWLVDQHPEFGMLWYDEELDVYNYSAPRGAIPEAYLGEVEPLRIVSMEEWGEEEDEY